MKRKRRFWYRMYVGECPVCGRDASYRERCYSKKPKRPGKRYVELTHTQTYCGCLER